MAEVKSDRRQALELAIASIDRQFGKGAIMRLGQSGALDEIGVIPTGALSLDADREAEVPAVTRVELDQPLQDHVRLLGHALLVPQCVLGGRHVPIVDRREDSRDRSVDRGEPLGKSFVHLLLAWEPGQGAVLLERSIDSAPVSRDRLDRCRNALACGVGVRVDVAVQAVQVAACCREQDHARHRVVHDSREIAIDRTAA